MQRVVIYADESRYRPAGLFIVAGVALVGHFDHVKQRLLEVEHTSGKGATKWQRTTEVRTRRRYLEGVLGIRALRGTAFYRKFEDTPEAPANGYWSTVETLGMAVKRFGNNRAAVIVHQGLNAESRRNMREYLLDTGHDNVAVDAGSMVREPRVRLADALAGFCTLLHSQSPRLDAYNGLPYENWFTELDEEGGN